MSSDKLAGRASNSNMTVTSTKIGTNIISFASADGMQTMGSSNAIISNLQGNQLPGWTYAK
jgi:hypothetical protein